jgi:hypothetical protein
MKEVLAPTWVPPQPVAAGWAAISIGFVFPSFSFKDSMACGILARLGPLLPLGTEPFGDVRSARAGKG